MSKKQARVFSSVGGQGAAAFWVSWLAELRKIGFDVEEVSAVSAGEYRSARGFGNRLILRLKMFLGMLFHLVIAAVRSPSDSVLITTTNPFYAPWLLATLVGSRHKVVSLVYDLYPETLVAAGKLSATSLPGRCLASLTGAALRKSHITVYLGQRIARYATQRYGATAQSEVIPVGADCGCFTAPPPFDVVYPVDLLYCGNLGVLHETDTLLSGLYVTNGHIQDALRFRFHASGPCIDGFIESARARDLLDWFALGEPLNNHAWQERMLESAVGLVLLKASAAFSAVPSKVYSAMAAGQAILAICPRESDLADIVLVHECGWVVEPDDIPAFVAALHQIAEDPACVARKRANAYRAAQEHFCMDIVAQKWKQLIEAL